MNSPFDLVLVGLRRDALRAARSFGLRILLVEERPVPASVRARVAGVAALAFDAPDEALRDALDPFVGSDAPRAVVAAGERGVSTAARIRAAYGVPGITPETARRARDKVEMKRAVRVAGVPCTEWVAITPETTAADVVTTLGLPTVFKERWGSGSRGVTIARTWPEVLTCLEAMRADPPERWMAERHVTGEEMSIESFVSGGRILFTNPTEYFVVGYANIAPANLDPAEMAALLALNAGALAALGIRQGMTHLELYRTAAGPLFGEVTVRPPGGRIMRLIRRVYGFDPWQAVIAVELGQSFDFPAAARRHGGVWMLHPGPGRVERIEGFDEARAVKGVRKLVCRLAVGDVVEARESTGRDTGWLEVSGLTRDAVAERLCRARQYLRVGMETGGMETRV
jgi:biotin carboxylase